MSETLSNPIELFYAGTHTDFRRKVVTVKTPELASAVSWFNANNQRLPLVVGHPNSEDDHFGVGTKLALVDGRVVITEVEGLDPTFRKIVNSGELPRVIYGEVSAPKDVDPKSQTANFSAAGMAVDDSDLDVLNRVIASGVDVNDAAAFSKALRKEMGDK